MIAYVYITIDITNNKLYIGAHKSDEFDKSYKGSGLYLSRAINKYGWDNFKCYMVRAFNDVDEAFEYEAHLIDKFNAVEDPRFYNLKPGGIGGFDCCIEAITGTKWVRNPSTHENKRIQESEIETYLSNGWEPGYYGSPRIYAKSPDVWVQKDDEEPILVPRDKLEFLESQGYVYLKRHTTNGRMWVNNGKKNKYIYPYEFMKSDLEGFVKGFLSNRPNGEPHTGKKIVNNGKKFKFVLPEEVPEYLRNGWELGIGNTRKRHSRKRTKQSDDKIVQVQ